MKITQKIIDQIPKAVEKSPFLQNTLTMIAEMQQQAKSIKKDAGEEVHKILEVLHHSYSDIEKKAQKLVDKWEEKKGTLPKQFVGQMDTLLKQVGLAKKKANASKKAPARKTTVAKKAAPVKKATTAKATAVKAKKVIKKVMPA
jgi:hypothetical protein